MTDTPPVIANSERWAPIAKLTERFFDLPVWKVLVQHTPTAEPDVLEYLAGELDLLDTEAWQKAESEKQRKYLIEQAYERHRTRGTDVGLIREAAEAGGQVRKIWSPPSQFFLGSSPTPAERNAWLSLHPELRLYPRRVPGQREGAHLGHTFLGAGCHTVNGTALLRSRLRVTLVKDGMETELESPSWEIANQEKEVVTEVFIPGKRGFASFLGTPISFTVNTNASLRHIVLKNVSTYSERTATMGLRTLAVGMGPMDADGEMISEVRSAPAGATFLGQCPRFLVSTNPELATYRRIKLFDPTVPLVRSQAASHLGYSRLTIPPHHAQVEVAFFGQRHPHLGRFLGRPLPIANPEPLKKLLNSMRMAARASDSITIDTRIFRPVLAGRALAGAVIAGGVSNTF